MAGFAACLAWMMRRLRPVVGQRLLADPPRHPSRPDPGGGGLVTPLQLIALGAMLILTGIALAVRAVRPPHRTCAPPWLPWPGSPPPPAHSRWQCRRACARRWVPVWLADQVSRHVGAS